MREKGAGMNEKESSGSGDETESEVKIRPANKPSKPSRASAWALLGSQLARLGLLSSQSVMLGARLVLGRARVWVLGLSLSKPSQALESLELSSVCLETFPA